MTATSWKARVAHHQAERLRHVAEDRFGRGDRRPAVLRPDRADRVVNRGKRGEEGRQAVPIRVLVRGIAARKRVCDLRCHGRHRRRVVPEMRIVAGLPVQALSRNNDAPLRRGRRGQQLVHPRVVVRAVENHHPGVRDRTRH
jgi:hypothetical protein